MTTYFINGAFLDSRVHQIPEGAVEVSEARRQELLESNLTIGIDQAGAPIALLPAPIPLEQASAEAQTRIDQHYQALFDQSVPNSAMKAEYDAAYIVAKHWLDNQTDPVPERIKALAESYGVTHLQAAGVVVVKWTEATAGAFDLRGAARLRAKLAIRQAVDLPGVAAAEAAGRAAMEAVVYNV